MVIVGLLAVMVQVLVAYAAVLATPSQRGQAVGTVTSGIVLGILLARFTSGLIADLAGWRAVYFVSSGLMLTLAAVFWKVLPVTGVSTHQKHLPGAHPFAVQAVHDRTGLAHPGLCWPC